MRLSSVPSALIKTMPVHSPRSLVYAICEESGDHDIPPSSPPTAWFATISRLLEPSGAISASWPYSVTYPIVAPSGDHDGLRSFVEPAVSGVSFELSTSMVTI